MELALKPTHKPVTVYFKELARLSKLGLATEGNTRPAFASLLRHCATSVHLTLAEEFPLKVNAHSIRLDGALLDVYSFRHGVWEAKDTQDDLPTEVKKKFDLGYPRDNILFQAPDRAILIQHGSTVLDENIAQPAALVDTLKAFFAWESPPIEQWQQAVAEFKPRIPDLAAGVLGLIEKERRENPAFIAAFVQFYNLCRAAINPNLSTEAVEEMLIQHLLTERLFRKVFDNPDFAHANVIAAEIEKVIAALTSRQFSKSTFLKPLDRFYVAIERSAALFDDYAAKQSFLNTVYEQFFQGFAVKVADTHGIVYTPQPIVDFMVRGVDELLRTHFGKSLATPGVHVLDPFVGTGNFLIRVMREMPRTALAAKFEHELHANEVMLLPYYIASMNIEHAFYELTGTYRPFPGLCLVDTFELAEDKQPELFSEANTERVNQQKAAPITVVIANPPYNAHQVNENDNNKNRKYPTIDRRVRETYAAKSAATNKNALADAYVKAFRFAADRIEDEGIVAFVSNNSFLSDLSFDGMRASLEEEFSEIYLVDLEGNVRRNPKISGTTHNVFGIQVGVSIALCVKRKGHQGPGVIRYLGTGGDWVKERRLQFLDDQPKLAKIDWQELQPDDRHTWLTEGLRSEFAGFIPLGDKQTKGQREQQTVFANYGRGVATCRDAWAWNFSRDALAGNIRRLIETYNDHVARYQAMPPAKQRQLRVDDWVENDPAKISWSRDLKLDLQRGKVAAFDADRLRAATYRPFVKQHLYFDAILNEEVYQFPRTLPTPATEQENRVIAVTVYNRKVFSCYMTNRLADLNFYSDPCQCFPLYTYDEDGSNRRENVTDWALAQFRAHYGDAGISREDIFYYTYGLLHHPGYRERYAADLKRELPRLPFAPDFPAFAAAGRRLAELHVNYESQPEYDLRLVEKPNAAYDLRVTKMRLTKDKTALVYNDFLTLDGIPPAVFRYRLGHKSALDWVIDQYQVKEDKRSGIVNDPNRADDEMYIVRLVRQVVTVSLETVAIVEGLPELGTP